MHLVYTENRDTKHIIDLQKVLITSFDGRQLTIILTLVGGITVHVNYLHLTPLAFEVEASIK